MSIQGSRSSLGFKRIEQSVKDSEITLVVGEEREYMFIEKEKIMHVDFFRCAFKDGHWREGRQKMIELPEDDPKSWRTAIDFLTRGDILPHIVATCECNCDHPENWCSDHHRKFNPPVQVINKDGVLINFDILKEEENRAWGYPEATQELFEDLLYLVLLARKYLWRELLDVVDERLTYFPVGPGAVGILAGLWEEPGAEQSFPPENFWNDYDREMQVWVDEVLQDHARDYDQAHHLSQRSNKENPYQPLNEFLDANMTNKARRIYRRLQQSRTEQTFAFTNAMDARCWECSQGRQGFCIKISDRAASGLNEGNVIGAGFPEIGDLITEIEDDGVDGYVSGTVLRTGERGRLPRDAIWFLEERDSRHCTGQCCEPPTFKYDGLTLYLHDPNDEGIEFRRERKIVKGNCGGTGKFHPSRYPILDDRTSMMWRGEQKHREHRPLEVDRLHIVMGMMIALLLVLVCI